MKVVYNMMTSSAYLRLKWKLEGKKIMFKKPVHTQCNDKASCLESLKKFRNHATQVIKSFTQQITQKIMLPPLDIYVNTQAIKFIR